MARITYKCTSCKSVLAVNKKPFINHNMGVPILKCQKCNLTFSTGKKMMRDLSKQEKIKFNLSIFSQVYVLALVVSVGLFFLFDYLFSLGLDSLKQSIKISILAGSGLVLALILSPVVFRIINKKAKAVENDQDNQEYLITDWFVGDIKK